MFLRTRSCYLAQESWSKHPNLKEFRQFYHLVIFTHSCASIYKFVLNYCRNFFQHGFSTRILVPIKLDLVVRNPLSSINRVELLFASGNEWFYSKNAKIHIFRHLWNAFTFTSLMIICALIFPSICICLGFLANANISHSIDIFVLCSW